jgi:hypothetical protein
VANTTKAINVSVGASLKELEQAMRDAGIMVEDFSVKAGKAGKSGSAGFDTLGKSVKDFKREQVQEGRLVGFYVGELGSFTGASTQAKEALSGMAQGMIGLATATSGVVIGWAAFELVAVAVKVIRDAMKEAEAAAKKAADAIEKIQKRIEAIGKSKRQVMLGEMGAIDAAIAEYNAANAELNEGNRGQLPKSPEEERWDKAAAAVQKYAKAYDQTGMSGLMKMRVELGKEYAAEEADAQNKIAIDQAKKQEDQKNAQVELAQNAANRILEIDAATGKKRVELARKLALDLAQASGIEAATTYDETGLADLKHPAWKVAQDSAGLAAAAKRKYDASQDFSGKDMLGPGSPAGEIDFLNNKAKETASAWGSVGESMSTVFSAIGEGISGAAGNFISMIGMMISKVLALIVALATASALQNGPAGWIIALPAAAGVLAGVIGMIAGISGRAEGGWVDGGRPYLVGERGPELVVPGQSGNVIPNHQLGGTINLYVNTMDAKSFGDALSQHDSELFRVLNRGARAGRV